MHKNSIDTYLDIIDHLQPMRKHIFRAIQAAGPINNRGLKDLLNIDINRITGRVKELRDLGVVIEAFSRKDPVTKRTTAYWMAKNG